VQFRDRRPKSGWEKASGRRTGVFDALPPAADPAPPGAGGFFVSDASSIETTIDFTVWMKQALRLAERGRGFTRINPLVGAIVLDRDGNKAGEGFHAVLGGPHAEVMAIQAAGPRARGGTLILNLEPCCHHGRTGPCTDAIREAGLARVVFSHRDPDPRVSGMGARILTKSGIEVLEGIEADNARELNASYLLNKLQGRPFVTVKLALSLDGRTADSAGYSKWITGPQCRLHAHALRARHDAIVVGAETARRDDPLCRTAVSRYASGATSSGRRPSLEQRIYERRQSRAFSKYNKRPKQKQGENDRQKPPLLAHLQELPELRYYR